MVGLWIVDFHINLYKWWVYNDLYMDLCVDLWCNCLMLAQIAWDFTNCVAPSDNEFDGSLMDEIDEMLN